MKAIIKLSSKNILNIYIFAAIDVGWNAQAIFFNPISGKIELDRLYANGKYGATRKIFIVETPKSGWTWYDSDENFNGKISGGYNWFLNGIDYKNKRIDPKVLEQCQKLQSEINIIEWNDIVDDHDIESLQEAAFGFHDSYVRSLKHDDDTIEIDFDTTWGCDIILKCKGNAETNLVKNYGTSEIADENSDGLILESAIFIEKGNVYWTDDSTIKKSTEIGKTTKYIKANKIFWKISFNKKRY